MTRVYSQFGPGGRLLWQFDTLFEPLTLTPAERQTALSMLKDNNTISLKDFISILVALKRIADPQTPTYDELRVLQESIEDLSIAPGHQCAHPANQWHSMMDDKYIDRTRVWNNIVQQSSATESQKQEWKTRRQSSGPINSQAALKTQASQSFTFFSRFPPELRNKVWKTYVDLISGSPRVVDLCSILSRNMTERLALSNGHHGKALPPMVGRELYSPASQTNYEARDFISNAKIVNDVKHVVIELGRQTQAVGFIKPNDVLFFRAGDDLYNWNKMIFYKTESNSETVRTRVDGVRCSQIAVDWQHVMRGEHHNIDLTERLLRPTVRSDWCRNWGYILRMKSVKTVYFLCNDDINIRVTMDSNYQEPASQRHDFEPPIKTLVDLYDDNRLREVLSLDEGNTLPDAPRWSQSRYGVAPCIECQRIQWEQRGRKLIETMWLMLCHSNTTMVSNKEAMEMWPLGLHHPDKEHPAAKRLLAEAPEFRPAVIINTVPKAKNSPDIYQMKWNELHGLCRDAEGRSRLDRRFHYVQRPF